MTRSLDQLKTVRVGEMTREEQLFVFRDAGRKLKAQMESPAFAEALERGLEDIEKEVADRAFKAHEDSVARREGVALCRENDVNQKAVR